MNSFRLIIESTIMNLVSLVEGLSTMEKIIGAVLIVYILYTFIGCCFRKGKSLKEKLYLLQELQME